jgi:hypothetical protein
MKTMRIIFFAVCFALLAVLLDHVLPTSLTLARDLTKAALLIIFGGAYWFADWYFFERKRS